MLPFEAPDSVQFRAVRLHGVADGLSARRRFEAALTGLAGSAFGIAPQALLIVRRMAPSARLRLDKVADGNEFGQAVRNHLAVLAQRAVRLAADPGAAAADSVLFADEAELVSCLLADWLRGRLGERWWWPSVLRGLSAGDWCRQCVLPRGDLVPAVLSGLATRGQAVAWVMRLTESEATRAVAQIMASHAMHPISGGWQQEVDRTRPAKESPSTSGYRHASRSLGPIAPAIALRRQLSAIIPEVNATVLSRSHRRLLAVGLGLQRASTWTRSPEFAVALATFEMRAATPVDNQLPAKQPITDRPEVCPPEEPHTDRGFIVSLPPLSAPVEPPIDSGLDPAYHVVREVPETGRTAHRGRYPSLRRAGLPQKPSDTPVSPLASASSGGGEPLAPFPQSRSVGAHLVSGPPDYPSATHPIPAEPSIESEPFTFFPETCSVETAFGGIFYLLNVALALGLYGDFTQPRAPGIELSPWDWLALIGREWFGHDFECDAIWALLEELAGRTPRQSPGYGFEAPPSWVIPAEWLEAWGKVDVVRVYATRRRLQLWHDSGFVLADTARMPGTAPLLQARVLCKKKNGLHRAKLLRVRRPPRQSSPAGRRALSRWTARINLYLQSRLARALGMDASPTVNAVVCCHSAMLACTTTRLDVHLSLADLPIEIRLAGLDRDPGWIPAAGRAIAFHFE
jgi:hypothetical protein